MRRAKADANQPAIVAALREYGCSVSHTHMVGKGFPDVVAGYQGKNYLIEIKDGDKPLSARQLTPDEKSWHESWHGDVRILESEQDVQNFMADIRAAGL